jgi:hypothetical protein
LPVIAIDRVMGADQFCSVVSDDRQACLQLTSSLLQPLPKQIVLIGARPELSISQERAAGFREALEGFTGEVIVEHGEAFSRDCGRQLMEQLLQQLGHLPDALVTTSYVLLQGVFDALHDFPLKSRPLRLGTLLQKLGDAGVTGVFQIGQDKAQGARVPTAQPGGLRVGGKTMGFDHSTHPFDGGVADALLFGLAVDDVAGSGHGGRWARVRRWLQGSAPRYRVPR